MKKLEKPRVFNVQINHPMFSIHYVAENIPLKEAIKVAKEQSKILCPKTVFIERVYQDGGTTVHAAMPYCDILKGTREMFLGTNKGTGGLNE